MQPAAPAGREPGEEPGLLFARPVTGALLLAGLAVARLLQTNIPHQVPAESGPAGLLDMQEHDHVVPFDVELHVSVQISLGEVEFGRQLRRAVIVQVGISVEVIGVLIRGRKQTHPSESLLGLKVTRTAARRTYVLITYHNKKHCQDGNQDELAGSFIHYISG